MTWFLHAVLPLILFLRNPLFRSRTVKTFRSYHRLHFVKYTLFAHFYCIFQLFICTDCFYHSDSSRLESRHTPPPAITATFRYIDDHLSESLLLEDIAKQVHLNPVYLTRIFKSYTGMPIQQLFQFFPDLLQASEALTEAVSDQRPCILLHPEFFRTDVILPVIFTEKELPAKGQQLSDQSGSHSVFRYFPLISSVTAEFAATTSPIMVAPRSSP